MTTLKLSNFDLSIHYDGLPKVGDYVDVKNKEGLIVARHTFMAYKHDKKSIYSCDELCSLNRLGVCDKIKCQLCFNCCFQNKALIRKEKRND